MPHALVALALAAVQEEGGNPMLLTVTTEKTLAQVREDLPRAVAAHGFGVMAVIDLKEKLREKGVDYASESVIFEVCNPHHAQRALEANPEIATALPCRIAVFPGPDGRVRISTLRPSRLVELYATPALAETANEVETAIAAILREAAAPAAENR